MYLNRASCLTKLYDKYKIIKPILYPNNPQRTQNVAIHQESRKAVQYVGNAR